jgi:hypothetical protein
MYQFLDEMDMWSLVEKSPKETVVKEILHAAMWLKLPKG